MKYALFLVTQKTSTVYCRAFKLTQIIIWVTGTIPENFRHAAAVYKTNAKERVEKEFHF